MYPQDRAQRVLWRTLSLGQKVASASLLTADSFKLRSLIAESNIAYNVASKIASKLGQVFNSVVLSPGHI